MKKNKILYITAGIVLLIFSSLNLAKQIETEYSLQTNLQLSLDIAEIKIKDDREPLWDDTGEFYFYREIAGEKVRLPTSGKISRKENKYIRPTDNGLEDEPFWHLTRWVENSDSQAIKFHGWEEDSEGDDDMGSLGVTLNLSDFQFISENTNRKLERGDYHIIFTIICEPMVSSTSHPDSSQFYINQNVFLNWTTTRPAIGILGYSYILDNNCCTEPDDIIEGTYTSRSYGGLQDGIYWFHVKAIDKAGFPSNSAHFKINIGKATDISPTIVTNNTFQLFQNYPNPFNSSTVISYHISQADYVTIEIYGLTGQIINRLIDSFHAPGSYKVIWNGKDHRGDDVSSGMYTYMIKVGKVIKTNKMTLLR